MASFNMPDTPAICFNESAIDAFTSAHCDALPLSDASLTLSGLEALMY